MSGLSGYDSEAVGFDSISQTKRSESTNSTQTSFQECGTGSQTNLPKDHGCIVTPGDLNAEDEILKEYPPPGLNDFLRKVVPSMLEQLDNNEKDFSYQSSDSEDEDSVTAKLLQELDLKMNMRVGAGDSQPSVLAVTWSSGGNSMAVSIGQSQHEDWCQHEGLIRVYTIQRSEDDKLVHSLDVSEKNCVTALQYHPSLAAFLAYGTSSGEVVLCDLRDTLQLSSPVGCHGSKRVSALQWADPSLANMYLIAQITRTGKRRGAFDQILVSSGSDGTINVWQVNANLKTFENVITYNVNSSRKTGAPDITCFDFIKVFPLRPSEEKQADDIFVVGTKTGKLFLCKTMTDQQSQFTDNVDPVYEVLEGHQTCILNVVFSYQKAGVFASVSMDSELRVYNVKQPGPLRVICLDIPISCLSWLPPNPFIAVLGLAKPEKQALMVYNIASGRPVKVDGLNGGGGVCAIAVSQSGTCRIAAGDTEGVVRVFDLPSRRIRLSPENLDF